MKTLYVDGGGTKTAVYLVDENQIIKKDLYDQCNLNTNFEVASKIIYKIINDYNGMFDQVVCGIAGSEAVKDKTNNLVEELENLTHKNIEIYNDVEMFAIICSQKFNQDFTLLNLGTGTACVNYKNNQFKAVLGWGKVIGDLGSGYDIGLNFLKFLTWCEDTMKFNSIYKKFLNDFELNSIREYVSLASEVSNIIKITNWLINQNTQIIENFVVSRVKKVIDYISFLNIDNYIFTGSIILKNDLVKQFLNNYLNNKSIKYLTLEELIEI